MSTISPVSADRDTDDSKGNARALGSASTAAPRVNAPFVLRRVGRMHLLSEHHSK